MTSFQAKAQSSALLGYLTSNPDRDIDEIKSWLRGQFGWSFLEPHYLIGLIRNKFGDECVVCHYSYSRSAYVYRLAGSLAEVYTYADGRTTTVLAHIHNIIGFIDRGVLKFPSEDPAQVAVLRDMLEDAADALTR